MVWRASGALRRLFVGLAVLALAPVQLQAQTSTTYTYDALGRLTGTSDAASDGIQTRPVTFSYDAAGNRIAVGAGAGKRELIVKAFTGSPSTTSPGLTTGLTVRGMADGRVGSVDTVHVTAAASDRYVTAELASALDYVSEIDIAAASVPGAGPANLNGAVFHYSTDGVNWSPVTPTAVSNVAAGGYKPFSFPNVQARFWRLSRTDTAALGIGEFRLFAGSGAPSSPQEPGSSPAPGELHATVEQGWTVALYPYSVMSGYANPLVTLQCAAITHGQLIPNPQVPNALTYTAPTDWTGTFRSRCPVVDANGVLTNVTVVITVVPPGNHPPITQPDTVVAIRDTPITFYPVANDVDGDNETLYMVSVDQPESGTDPITVNTDTGAVTFKSRFWFTGTMTIPYTMRDARGLQARGNIFMTVNDTPAGGRAPVANNDSRAVTRNTAITFRPQANDTDLDADKLLVQTTNQPANGGVTINDNGVSVTYTPNNNFVGTDYFTYTIHDGRGLTANATVTLNVSSQVNRNPTPQPDTMESDYGGGRGITYALNNDTDPDGDDLKIVGVTNGAHGTVELMAGFMPYYWPTGDWYGVDTFTYSVMDGRGGIGTATITVTTLPPPGGNRWPTPVADDFTVPSYKATTLNVVANDTDPEGDAREVTSVSAAAYGTTSQSGTSSVIYTPAPGYVGDDAFSYMLNGGRRAMVTVHVSPNLAPSAVNDTLSAPVTSGPYAFDPRTNDTDPEGNPLTISAVGTPAHGTVTITGGGTGLSYAPNPLFGGVDSFGYTLSDGFGGTSNATVTITVQGNTGPTATNDTIDVAGGIRITFDPRTNDNDLNSDPLTITLVSTPAHGAVSIVNSGGQISYRPAADYVGSDTFNYTISDGRGGTATATVTATVFAPRSFTISPEVAGKATWNLDSDGPLNLGSQGSWTITPVTTFQVPVKFWGAGGGSSKGQSGYGGAGGYAGGTVTLTQGVSYTVAVPSGGGPGFMLGMPGGIIGTGSWDSIGSSAGYGAISRTSDNVPVLVAGGGGSAGYGGHGGAGGGASAQAGTAAGGGGGGGGGTQSSGNTQGFFGAQGVGNYAGSGGGGYRGGLGGSTGGSGGGGGGGGSSYYNPSFVSGGVLTAGVGTTPGNASDPDRGGAGAVATDYVSRSASGRLIMVAPAAQPPMGANTNPVAGADSVSIRTGGVLTFDPRLNDSDADLDILSVGSLSIPGHGTATLIGGAVTYTPANGYVGADSFTYVVSDGRGGSAQATVSVNVTPNIVPSVTSDSVTATSGVAKVFDPRSNDTDADGDTLTITQLPVEPSHGTATITGGGTTITYTPTTGYTGPDTLTYTVSDGAGGTATGTINITVVVTPVTWNPADKDAAFALSNGNLTATVTGQSSGFRTVRSTAARSTGKWYYEGVFNPGPNRNVLFGIASAALPLTTYVGQDAVSHGLYAYNGTALTAGGGVGGGPNFGAIPSGTTVKIAVDLVNNRIWYKLNSGLWNGSATANPGANVGGLPLSPGAYYAAFSGEGFSSNVDQGTANFGATAFAGALPRGFAPWDASTAPAPNSAPVAANDTVQAEPNVAKVFDPRSNDTDANADPLTITQLPVEPSHGTATITGGGTAITYTPTTGYTGPDTLTYTVSDGAGGTATGTINITVVVAPVTWSTTDKNANVALSNGNLTATGTASGNHAVVRATVSRSSGKYYYEATLASMPSGAGVGIATGAASLGNGAYVGSDANGYGWYMNGRIFNAGGFQQTHPTFAGGDRIGVAVDLTTNKVWWSKNGIWTGNPAQGTGGYAIAAGAYFPALSNYDGAVITGNFGATAFAANVPRDFAPWDASSGPAPNQSPVATNDTVHAERNVAKVFDPRTNDTDADADPLTITQIASAPSNGTAIVTGGGTTITYTPTTGYTGSDSLTYTVSDGAGGTATATVNLSVVVTPVTWNPADKSPSMVLSNGSLTVTQTAGFNGDNYGVRSTAPRSGGKYYFEATLSGDTRQSIGVATASWLGVSAPSNSSFVGGVNSIGFHAELGQVYSPNGALTPAVTVVSGDTIMIAVDLDGKKFWAKRTADAYWNNSPTASPAQGLGGAAFTLSDPLYAAASNRYAGGLTANFGATAFAATLPRGFAPWDASAGPAPNQSPVATSDTVQADRNAAKVFDPRTNDTDADADPLTITQIVTGPTNGTATITGGGTTITYTPTTGYTGSDSLTYMISDGVGGTATATVNLSVVVTPVTWNPADKNANIALSGGNLVAGASSGGWKSVRAGTSRSSGKYYFEATIAGGLDLGVGVANAAAPMSNYIGADTNGVLVYAYVPGPPFVYGGTGVSLWSSGAITSGDQIQVAVDLNAKRLWAKQTTDTIWNNSPTDNPATGVGGFDITVPIAGGALFPAASVQSSNGTVTGNFGATAFAAAVPHGFTAWDASTPPANQVPVAADDSIVVAGNVAKVFDPLVNDADPDGDTLSISGFTSAANGGVAITGGGTRITYTPANNFAGIDTFTYTISDGQGGSNTATVNVVVNAVVTWSATDKNSNVVLSTDKLTLSTAGQTWPSPIRATQSRSTGKYYFEVNWTTVVGSTNASVGVATATASMANYNYVGRPATSYGYRSNRYVTNNEAAIATYSTYGSGTVIGVAVDLTAGKIWWQKNGVWNGDPVAGAGGVALPTGTYFPSVSLGGTEVATTSFGVAAFTYGPPAGFLSWNAP